MQITTGFQEVIFTVNCPYTFWGDHVAVVGNCAELGSWDPQRGLELKTSAETFPQWQGRVQVPVGQHEFKFVIVRGWSVEWEANPNRPCVANVPTEVLAKFHEPDTKVVSLAPRADERQGESTAEMPSLLGRLGPGKVQATEEVKDKTTIVSSVDEVEVFRTHTDTSDSVLKIQRLASRRKQVASRLHFTVVCSCTEPGDGVSVVGSCSELGHWDVMKGVKLTTSPELFPKWKGVAHVHSALRDIDFKVVVVRKTGNEWESHQNRRLSMPDEEAPLEAFLHFNVNGCEVQPMRTEEEEKKELTWNVEASFEISDESELKDPAVFALAKKCMTQARGRLLLKGWTRVEGEDAWRLHTPGCCERSWLEEEQEKLGFLRLEEAF